MFVKRIGHNDSFAFNHKIKEPCSMRLKSVDSLPSILDIVVRFRKKSPVGGISEVLDQGEEPSPESFFHFLVELMSRHLSFFCVIPLHREAAPFIYRVTFLRRTIRHRQLQRYVTIYGNILPGES